MLNVYDCCLTKGCAGDERQTWFYFFVVVVLLMYDCYTTEFPQ